MYPSPATPPDSSDGSDAAVRVRDHGDSGSEQTGARLQRVRQLPPPPTAFHEPRPHIEADELLAAGWRHWWSYVGRRLSSACGVSFLFHFFLLLGLALLVQASRPGATSLGLAAYFNVPVPLSDAGGDARQVFLARPDRALGGEPGMQQELTVPRVDLRSDGSADPIDSQRVALGMETAIGGTFPMPLRMARPADWLLMTDAAVGGGLDGRGREARTGLAKQDGGTAESELAVERGLRWLLAHQREDGSWNFDHHKSICQGQCRHPGTEASTTAATAMALMAFLGAGYTHTEGEYQDVVKRGLYYLVRRTLLTPHGNDVRDGTMYAQGFATIVLCEAYAMTKDAALKDYAQGVIDFICYAQDPRGGGWRYIPGEPGDTTVTGWQLMGLKSGQMAKLRVPSPTIFLARRFLTSVQYDDGAQYGYLNPQPRKTTTAVGLLMRMYTGWRHDHPALYRGVRYLDLWGPSETNLYYDYYATQVMRHWGGPEWEKWNRKMRDHLTATQASGGHEAGSWYFQDPYGDKGGRLYNTAMAVMILEVYYRYMPLYRTDSVDSEFF